ncbi:ubiquitin carboxyl-terminal hydrolase Usp2 isoform X3 [Bradysia coprophila]|uniref:ubiquitin carboxyl-terminal hydrolase Usp2 isoform X3 n=1 Tax=Bradysia coprophila TaxID=38358 RepID=UPI00187DC245|nr:ubiquitin carboxyl-terminal hydrolase Usp2 isoform X3 [Bradysia coprophila]
MPVLSSQRFSTTTGNSYLPSTYTSRLSTNSGTTSSLYSSNRQPHQYRSSLTTSSGYGSRSDDSSRFGVSRYTTRSSFDKPPTGSSATSSRFRSESRSRDYSLDGSSGSALISGYSSSSSATKSDSNSYHNTKRQSPSSLARSVATSGADLYEKYSPSHYIPKLELSRSRSLSETTSSKLASADISNARSFLRSASRDRDTSSPVNSSAITSKIRNTSLRSLPPSSSSSPSSTNRYWDREGRSTLSSRTLGDSDAFNKSLASSSISDVSDDSSEGLCGLRNIGNTCFMNSVIQCLSHTSELSRFLKTKTDGRSTTKDQRILVEFAKLIRDMWTTNTRSVTPSELKSAFSCKHRMYSGCQQQDAQEFLRFFLDSLHSACNTGTKGGTLEIDDNLSDNKKADLTWEWYTKVENSMIKDLFVGQLKSSLKCTQCGNTSVTFDPFWDLSVPLPSSSKCKLESCLDLFIKEEVLDGDEMPTCSKCKTRRKSTKTFTIQRFPKYLVIHLKRFSETRWSKLSNIVEFPTGDRELNMAPYAANSSSALYSLYGISNHMGSTAGGHYVALCKHPVTKKWHEFNDNMVHDASESGLVSSSAYLLFYERA